MPFVAVPSFLSWFKNEPELAFFRKKREKYRPFQGQGAGFPEKTSKTRSHHN